MQYKQGDVRDSDGRVFFSYLDGGAREWWLNPVSFILKKMRMAELSREATARKYRDPITGPIMKQAAKEAMAKKRLEKPEIMMLVSIRCKCKRLGIEFNLDLEDIYIPEVCPALGKPIYKGDKTHPFSPTLDRINPGKGYTKGNVIVISHRANSIKSNATADEILAVGKFLKRIERALAI